MYPKIVMIHKYFHDGKSSFVFLIKTIQILIIILNTKLYF